MESFIYSKMFCIITRRKKLRYYENKIYKLISKGSINIRQIEKVYIPNTNNQYKENNKLYYEFHIKQSNNNKIWIFRVNDKELRNKWINAINTMYKSLKLTLTRLVKIMSYKKYIFAIAINYI